MHHLTAGTIAAFLSVSILIIFPVVAHADQIPTRNFVANSVFTDMKISPDGSHVAFTYDEDAQRKLGIINLTDEVVTASFGLGENQFVTDFWWASNERIVMSVARVTGYLDTMYTPARLYASNVDGRRRQQLLDSSSASFEVLHPLPDDPDHILIARYPYADGGVPRAHRLHIRRGETRYLGDQPGSDDLRALLPDTRGEIRIGIEVITGEHFDDTEIILNVRRDDGWQRLEIDSQRRSPEFRMLGFSADNRKAYFLSNHDMARNDRLGVFRYDFDNDRIDKLYRHEQVDVHEAIHGPAGEVIGVAARLGPRQYHVFDEQHDDAQFLYALINAFEDQDVEITSFTRDGARAIVRVSSDRNPGQFYLFDVKRREARFLGAALPDLNADDLAQTLPIAVEARDGTTIHALLTLPEGERSNLPMVVDVHGGPFGITDHWEYHPLAQFLAHHGFATLQVNFRGSGNRGADFRNAGRRQWGRLMQDDVTDLTRTLVNMGVADENRLCISGGSYGGYAALMGVIRDPDLFQCAVGIVGVYDLVWFREGDGSDFAAQVARGRDARAQFERFMDAHVGENPEALEPVSPVHNVDRIQAPVFIVHGGADVRVPVGHAERLRNALNEAGQPYEWMIKEDEGHGFFDEDNRVELFDRMLQFFETHIGQNNQEQASSEP